MGTSRQDEVDSIVPGPLVNFLDMPYTLWSDNKFCPVVGVPSPLLMSWPDIYFHTQLLTADNLDPKVFRRCGLATALTTLELANAGPVEAHSRLGPPVTMAERPDISPR